MEGNCISNKFHFELLFLLGSSQKENKESNGTKVKH